MLMLEKYFLLFFMLSVLGWLMEVACKYIEFHRFINRGFLIGPYCPIYGVGSVLIILLLERFSDTPLELFLMSMIVCGTLEYITSYLMEKIFHARWWDYSQKPFNLNGRVCANTLIPFGLLGLLLVYVIKPFLFGIYDRMPALLMHILCAGLLAILIADASISTSILGRIRKSANLTGADDTETLTRCVREKLSQQGVLIRRAIRAYPYMKLYNRQLLRQMRETRQRRKAEAVLKRRQILKDLDDFEKSVRQYREKRKSQRERRS